MDREFRINKPDIFTVELFEGTSDLAESLAQSEAIMRFTKSNQALTNDQDAQQLVQEANELHQKLYAKDASSDFMREKFPRYRELHNQIASNPVLQEQSEAQEIAINFLREINQEISQLLGVESQMNVNIFISRKKGEKLICMIKR
ncbi:MAG: YlbF family regulator, partial [Brevefilum sp.]|nr:YlbF family regulator [Brevefilum sp.]